ncbi:MAG: 2-oxoacid:ferredoxin oxidoreductase subunit beta [Spirochaetales bacterium]|nr:2-oxoacid:ferredoxin oxidoreductase subunit beta [Leptospiraceae bacterium]MCP5481847.1 2-oxoacid:ferredoxin oxidoreductase subunit beta [Spirochaetales bacterium]MCP5486346.1 2-oxoacid:ferredoxin oxidoreductase subunit beta [Spirochaetales bacterium]
MSHPLTKKDFVSDQEVKWCPGCGDYAILAAIQKTMPELGVPKEDIVFISGIGCSSRFPYYMNTYGFHTIHGRAPALATGLAISRPELSIWVVTGDGDGLSIGGNHLIHAMRRNLNLNILLFNNQTYGLTKGQYSPTSRKKTVSKSTPFGSIDEPFNPVQVALGAGATFVARTYDKDQKHMSEVFRRAHEHRGCSFVEIYQNCVIFNDAVFEGTIGKDVRSDNVVYLENGKPLVYGKTGHRGLAVEDFEMKTLDLPEGETTGAFVHREDIPSPAYATMLGSLRNPEFPEPMGVFRAVEGPVYEDELERQNQEIIATRGEGDLETLLASGDTWVIG